jgi:hypothetical protein
MDHLQTNVWEFNRRKKAFDDELQYWIDRTGGANKETDLLRHHSQVCAFADLLRRLSAGLQQGLADPRLDVTEVREKSKVILGLFRIWEFLRAKLVQRREIHFKGFLRLADEYAWICYQPIYEAGLKRPPLVFLNGGYSPFTLTRNDEFQAESVPRELIRSRTLVDAMASLPFPVIGVPWYLADNLAELSVIGHEIGHSVEADLGLSRAICSAIEDAVANAERNPRWRKWGSEIFADLYGVVSCGSAFVSSLASFLSTENLADEPDKYPPAAVRFHFNVAVLRGVCCTAAADRLVDRWKTRYVVADALLPYANDVEDVAVALLDKIAVGGKTMRELRAVAKVDEQATELARAALRQEKIWNTEPLPILVAAYRLSYDKLVEKHNAATAMKRLSELDRVKAAMEGGLKNTVRAGETAPSAKRLRAEEEFRARSAALWLNALRS